MLLVVYGCLLGIFVDHSVGPGRAVGPVTVRVCVRAATLELNDI